MLGDLMSKMNEVKKRTEEAKLRLENITVIGESANGKIKIKANGNKKVIDVYIDNDLLTDKVQLEDFLIIAINNVLKSAENIHDAEMKSIAKGLIPGIPGIF